MKSKGDTFHVALKRCRFQREDPYEDVSVPGNATSAVIPTDCSGLGINMTPGSYPDFKERGQ